MLSPVATVELLPTADARIWFLPIFQLFLRAFGPDQFDIPTTKRCYSQHQRRTERRTRFALSSSACRAIQSPSYRSTPKTPEAGIHLQNTDETQRRLTPKYGRSREGAKLVSENNGGHQPEP